MVIPPAMLAHIPCMNYSVSVQNIQLIALIMHLGKQ